MRVVVLDMGQEKYGDCVYLDLNGFTVLIDGGHPGDNKGGANLPKQLKEITKKIFTKNSRREFDLLVVTHSHTDHLGCLPELVADGVITAKMALVSDPDNRYGPESGQDAMIDALPPVGRAVLDMIGEELPDPTDPDFASAVDAFLPVEPRYRAMMRKLEEDGTTVVRYMTDSLKPITDFIKPHGLKILGPTRAHIELCAQRLQKAQDAAARRIRDALARDAAPTKAELYKIAIGAPGSGGTDALDPLTLDALDADKNKGAINDLSIVMTVEEDGKKILLPGDMQFAEAQVDGLDEIMAALLKKVSTAGPYDAIKIPHHTSYNAWNEKIHNDTLKSPILIHSGGSNDSTHPEKNVLTMMKKFSAGHTFLRTDRNGMIELRVSGGELETKFSGAANNFTANKASDVSEGPPEPVGPYRVETPAPGLGGKSATDIVRVIAEIPHTATKVTITVEVTPQGVSVASPSAPPNGGSKRGSQSEPNPGPPGGAETLDGIAGLLFLTNARSLSRKIGAAAVEALEAAVERQGAGWSDDLPTTFSHEEVMKLLEAQLGDRNYRGVVLLGDYDVVPPARFDCLPPEVRAGISPSNDDPDNFVVWSDSPYGDRDGDGIQELPVSRVPDCGSAQFLTRCLQRKARPLGSHFAVRNVNRPFADQIRAIIPGGVRNALSSEPSGPDQIDPQLLRSAHVYFMLHGSDFDAGRYWGEADDSYLEAVNLSRIPVELDGAVVFTGCCWGALIGREPAYRVVGLEGTTGRTTQQSLALACLERGASAYVGCTGAHYSPLEEPYGYYGGPLHTHFWTAIANGQPPARALFDARQQYLRELPHATPGGLPAVDELAIELKIYHQFTCLGLGW